MSWTDRIKKLVSRDKKEQIAEKGKGWTFDDPFSSVSGNLVVDAGYTNLKSALTMDQSLLARFADYENMDDYPELSCCLDIFSDDTTITDNLRGKTIWGESKDTILKDIIDDCLHRRLRIEEDIWLAIRTLCKYGNVYAEIITTDIGVVGLNFLPVPTMRRLVTMKGDLVGFIQDLKGRFNTEGLAINDINKLKEQTKERGMIFFEPWEIVHWRLQSKFTNSLYGYAVFDAARWVWKRLVMLEDTALLYQLTRSPGRYAFYIDTGDLPPDEAMALVKKVKRQYKKRTLVNPSTGELEFRNNPLCLTGDTKIPLLDGRILSLSDIVNEYEKGKKLWVYSCSILKGNKLMPMPISWAGKTRENAKLVKITLDNGEIIRCTPDHKFPTRKGEKISASDLCPGDSLMPFRRYKDKITRIDKLKGELNGYEKVYDPSDKKWKWTHRIVGEEVHLACEGQVVHHKDFNRCNNDPSNLEVLSSNEHYRLHRESGRNGGAAVKELRKIDKDLDDKFRNAASRTITAFNKTERQRKRTSERNKRLNTKKYLITYNKSEKHKKDNIIRSIASKRMWLEKRDDIVRKCRLDFDEEVWEWLKLLCNENPTITFREVLDKLNSDMREHLLSINEDYRYASHDKIASARVLKMRLKEEGYHGLGGFKKTVFYNHKVVSVEYLDEREDTYTLTINGTHTFALDAGIFVFNSPEDDMWIPTRSGKESARVDVLSGPDWQSMDSIEYLRDKMFTSIKIPRSYYGGDAEAEQGLAQKDVRFARTCMRIQREFRNGIRQILRVHLAAINIDPDTVEWDTRMTMPSSIFELQQIEVMNAQAGLIETLSQFFPKEWLLRRILHLSQDDAVSVVNDKMSEEERALMDQARIASSIEKRYPGIDIGDATISDVGQEARNEEVKVSREIKKLTEMVSKSMQESNRVIKKLEEMDLSSKRDTRKIDNSIKYIRRVK
jgi:hypothetical protein